MVCTENKTPTTDQQELAILKKIAALARTCRAAQMKYFANRRKASETQYRLLLDEAKNAEGQLDLAMMQLERFNNKGARLF